MSRRINRPQDRLVARYLTFRRRWTGRSVAEVTVEAREVDLPFACAECGDRSVVETECDACGVTMRASAALESAYR